VVVDEDAGDGNREDEDDENEEEEEGAVEATGRAEDDSASSTDMAPT
jgi:hypothetical protein